jgi:hypothetical protein
MHVDQALVTPGLADGLFFPGRHETGRAGNRTGIGMAKAPDETGESWTSRFRYEAASKVRRLADVPLNSRSSSLPSAETYLQRQLRLSLSVRVATCVRLTVPEPRRLRQWGTECYSRGEALSPDLPLPQWHDWENCSPSSTLHRTGLQ